MTVTVGPDRYLGASTLLGATSFLGQGNSNTARDVEYELLFSVDDASTSIPTWVYITSSMRAFSTSRGRSSERGTVDAGTATITLDNRDRTFDPGNTASVYSPNLRPMNRVWLRARFNGVTHDIFKGYVESYEQQYPELGMDAVTIVKAVDEFKVLALRNQPTSDPPRETYADVVQFDQPFAYWRMSDAAASFAEQATVGSSVAVDFSVANGMSSTADGAINGDNPNPSAALIVQASQFLASESIPAGQDLNPGGLSAFTAECWMKVDSLAPVSNHSIFAMSQFSLAVTTTGNIQLGVLDAGGTPHFVSASGGALLNQWAHVVGMLDSGTQRLYVNGVQVASGAFASTIYSLASTVLFGSSIGSIPNVYIDEAAIYRYALPVARILAHYTAGVNRGFARSQLAGERIGRVLDSISHQAPRNLMPSYRPLAGQWTGGGPSTLDVLREIETADALDAMLFITCDGTVTFLSSDYRSIAPYDTVQATFGDIGNTSELDFMDIQVDYSDSFIANEWNVTREGGSTFTSSDATSQSRYLKRPQSLTGLKLADDTYTQSIADIMVAKYKDPLTRVLSITPKTMDVNVIDAVFPLDLGDRVTVKLTPPGGGTRFSQTLFIQSITIDATPQAVFPTVQLGVSPV